VILTAWLTVSELSDAASGLEAIHGPHMNGLELLLLITPSSSPPRFPHIWVACSARSSFGFNAHDAFAVVMREDSKNAVGSITLACIWRTAAVNEVAFPRFPASSSSSS
jgi:hypothetical protein